MRDIEKLLQTQGGAKPTRSLRSNFTREVAKHIKSYPRPMSRRARLKETFYMKKLIQRPAMAGFSILAVIAISGTAYAATVFNWFGTDVQTSVKENIVTVSNKDCPSRISNSTLGDWKPKSDSETSYKILKPELITPEDIQNSHLVDCEHNALDALSAKYYPASYDYRSYGKSVVKDGIYLPVGTYGTVEAIRGSDVIVRDVHINDSPYAADHITTTLRTQPETQVINQGGVSTLAEIQPGDQVYFTFQNKATPDNENLQMVIPGKPGSKVLMIAKTQYDYRLMDKVTQALIKNGPVRIIKSNNPNGGG